MAPASEWVWAGGGVGLGRGGWVWGGGGFGEGEWEKGGSRGKFRFGPAITVRNSRVAVGGAEDKNLVWVDRNHF